MVYRSGAAARKSSDALRSALCSGSAEPLEWRSKVQSGGPGSGAPAASIFVDFEDARVRIRKLKVLLPEEITAK
ncbi:MAG: hypothetical protein HC923_08645 [Myxococcales bacterium]|nr:hypothetical protein [Myxococcales bacterium]